jgi:hypothetical protein
MARTNGTIWRHWADAWLSGLTRGGAEGRAAEGMMAAVVRELDRGCEEAVRSPGLSRFLGSGLSAEAGAARPAASAGG